MRAKIPIDDKRLAAISARLLLAAGSFHKQRPDWDSLFCTNKMWDSLPRANKTWAA